MSFYRNAGELIFGTRLRRLSDRFLLDVSRTYKRLSIPFETSWFPLFFLLDREETLSVTEIARELEITHSAVSQLASNIAKRGYIEFYPDAHDRRKRIMRFTSAGRELVEQVRPVWGAIQRAMCSLLEETDSGAPLFTALDSVEDSLSENSLHERILDELDNS